MAERAITPAGVPKTYAELRRSVEETLLTGQRLIDQAKVRTYHETGRLLREHLRLHEAESNYGTQTMQRLSADLKISDTVLYRCIRLVECFPILATWPKLTWAHFRELIPIADVKQRRALATEANRNGWPVASLVARIRQLAPAEKVALIANPVSEAPELLKPIRGTPGLHLIVEKSFGLSVDLGFRHYWPLSPDQAKRFAKGDIVRIANDDSLRLAADATKAQLFTYTARPVRVVDGDTLVVALEVSPGVFIEQKLRLRDLDCPEMDTPAGKAAKRFTESLVNSAKSITISTTKPDKYDRYLADVFIRPATGDAPFEASAKEGEIFLNNALLENGHAVVKKAWEFADWGLEG